MHDFVIYPCPQWLEFGTGVCLFGEHEVPVWVHPECAIAGESLRKAASRLGVSVRVVGDPLHATIAIGTYGASEISLRVRECEGLLSEPLPAEGYYLVVSPGGATIAGADASGCLYGVNALSQLLRRTDGRLAAPVVQVRDWPYKPMRGAHIYLPGREGIPFFKDLLAWLSSLRYNVLFLEVGGGMRYDRHPEVNETWARFCEEARAYPGGPQALQESQPYPKDSTHTELARGGWLEKEEVADIISYANSYGIEVVPELQSLSHCYYLVLPHPEIAERPWDPWPDTYCPSNPLSYELYFDVAEEVIEVFRPRMMHIGHDEAYTFGVCDRCRDKTGAELLAGDLNKIHDFLAERGIRTVLWGDKLQNIVIGGVDHGGRARRSVSAARQRDYTMRETYQAVDFVPKDMLIMDWYWQLDPLSEQFFRRKGFEVIFGNFGQNFAPQAFSHWDRRSVGEDVLGAEVSTWCDVSEYALGHNLAFFNFVFSANMLWWRHYTDREREATLKAVALQQARAREAVTRVTVPSSRSADTTQISLREAGNTRAEAIEGATGDWTGAISVPFALPDGAVRADVAVPESSAIDVARKAASVVFLHYCIADRVPLPTWSFVDPLAKDDGNLLGYYLVRYEDGTRERVEIRYGDNISCADRMYGESVTSSPFWAQPAWQGRSRESRLVTLWAHEWVNPHPARRIADIKVQYTGSDAQECIVLLAITLVH